MAKTPGAMWVSGTDLHWVDNTGYEWRQTGSVVKSAAPTGYGPGDVQVSTTNNHVVYVDASNAVRSINATSVGAKPAAASKGEISISTNSGAYTGKFYYVGNDSNLYHFGFNNHGNSYPHSDSPHSDAHADYTDGLGHLDHNDTPHSDGSNHSDSGYTDNPVGIGT